jgi:hypothetical protein
MRTLGLFVAALLGLLLLGNGLTMLFSPKTWFNLPSYLGLRGSIRRDTLSRFEGRLGIRTMGFLITSAFVTIILSLWKGPMSSGALRPAENARIYEGLCVATCLVVGGHGLAMLIRPGWWVDRYLRSRLGDSQNMELARSRKAIEVVARILSLLVIGPAFYFAFECIAKL